MAQGKAIARDVHGPRIPDGWQLTSPPPAKHRRRQSFWGHRRTGLAGPASSARVCRGEGRNGGLSPADSNHSGSCAVLTDEFGHSRGQGATGKRGPNADPRRADMKPTTRAARRGLAALAVTAAAVAIPTTALAASGSPAKPAAAARAAAEAIAPRCGTAALTAWLGIPGDGYAGGVVYQLELSNTSNHTCSLYGFPGVSALAPGGHQLGKAGDPGP